VKEISCVADTGNNGNALPFSQLDILAGRIGPGEKALAISVESSKWIKAGFALEAL
jgi:3-oxoacyl-[acyl-carrier-protein] synthase-3